MVKYYEDRGLFGKSAEELEEYFKNAMGYAHHLNDVLSDFESFNHLPSTDEIEDKKIMAYHKPRVKSLLLNIRDHDSL
jgi:hypothetical protein